MELFSRFCKLNKLNLEDVYETKAMWIMSQLSSVASIFPFDTEKMCTLMVDFESILKQLTNLEFMVKCCLNASCVDLKSIRKLLMMARNTIQNNLDRNLDESLMIQVSQALHRLDTFIFLKKGMQSDQVQIWLQFMRGDMMEECKKLMDIRDFQGALILWTRHQSDFQIHTNDVLSLLNYLPRPNPEEIEFYNSLVTKILPDCLHLIQNKKDISQVLEILAKWIIHTTKRLETERKFDWPQSGIDHAQLMLESLHFIKGFKEDKHNDGLISVRIPLLLQEHKHAKKSPLNKLISLIETLKDLNTLHKVYKLKVKLNDFDVDDKTSVANHLMDWCSSPQEIESLIQNFLKKFLAKFGYDHNEVFAQYVNGLVKETEFCWYYNDSAPWEKTVLVIIKAIDCISTKFELILTTLRQAPAPWSSDIQDLVQLGT